MAFSLDEALEDIQPPQALLSWLHPPNASRVDTILQLLMPTQLPDTWKDDEWFATNKQLSEDSLPESLGDLVLPAARQCWALDGELLRSAVENGHTTVCHPSTAGIFLPLWMTRVWKWANVLVNAHTFWAGKMLWVHEIAANEQWSLLLRARTIDALKDSPWKSGFSNIQRGSVLASHLASILLSDKWLDGDVVNSLMDVVRADIDNDGGNPTVAIANSALCSFLQNHEMHGETGRWGERLRSGSTTTLVIPYNIPQLHWFLLVIDVRCLAIDFGDSSPSITAPYCQQIITVVKQWLRAYLPGKDFVVNLGGIPISCQLDDSSCGIAMSNAIHRLTLPNGNIPMWNPIKPFEMRAYFFCRCLEHGLGVSAGLLQSASNSPVWYRS